MESEKDRRTMPRRKRRGLERRDSALWIRGRMRLQAFTLRLRFSGDWIMTCLCHLRILMTTNASRIRVTISSSTNRLLFLSHITKFAFSRVKGSRDLSILKRTITSSLLNSPLSTRISPVRVFSNLWPPTQNGFEYLLLSHRSNSS